MERKSEVHDPPEEERTCPCCGLPFVKNGSHESEVVEIEVKAHVRTIRRNRWRSTCSCPSTPKEVAAPPVPRLFPDTSFGISVWSCFLFERHACHRPLNRVAAWMRDQGLPVSAGTLADGVRRMIPLFEPLSQAILERVKGAGMLHGDETGWRVRSLKDVRGTGKASYEPPQVKRFFRDRFRRTSASRGFRSGHSPFPAAVSPLAATVFPCRHIDPSPRCRDGPAPLGDAPGRTSRFLGALNDAAILLSGSIAGGRRPRDHDARFGAVRRSGRRDPSG